MNNNLHRYILLILLLILCGSLPSTARAGNNLGAGDNKLNQIRHNPCGNGIYDLGGTHSIPTFSCNGWGGVSAKINVLVREWGAGREYPFVGDPFLLNIGVDLDGRGFSFERGDISFNNKIRFFGYTTEIRLVPIKVVSNWDFNGTLAYDSVMTAWEGLPNTIDPKYLDGLTVPVVSSAGDETNEYYPIISKTNPGVNPYLGGVDVMSILVVASKSSYHAETPSTYRGEPAYRLSVTSKYLVQVKASWDDYQKWEIVHTGDSTVCSPGPNSGGSYECMAPSNGWWEPGHYVTVPIYDYKWGTVQGEGDTGWVNTVTVETDLVRWPDGTLHDHIPILIYQSQPLLQQP